MEAAVTQRVSLVTDSEVLQEILYRYFSLQKPDVAREVYQAATGLCDEVLPVSERTTARARELLLRYTDISARDAIHIASMEEGGLRRLPTRPTVISTLSMPACGEWLPRTSCHKGKKARAHCERIGVI